MTSQVARPSSSGRRTHTRTPSPMQRLRPRTLLWVRSRRGAVCQGLRTPVGAAGSLLVLPAATTTTPRAAPAAVGARSASTTACVEDRRGGGQRGWRDSGVEHGGGGDRSWAVGRVKRKIAAVVAFCGQRYLGFQFNGDSASTPGCVRCGNASVPAPSCCYLLVRRV